MSDISEVKVSAIKVRQPVGDFYQAVIPWGLLSEISYADVRAIEEGNERKLDRYMGIQRKIDKKRIKDIVKYVENVDATFPTSIVIAIDEDNIEWFEDERVLRIFDGAGNGLESVAKILDGQHRVEGIKNFSREVFDLPVTIFVGADMPTQANIFATVNLAQTKVNRSLVYDLFEYETSRSPQKSCHEIAVALDSYEDSPFFKRIKRLGTATPGRSKELLTQAVIVESIIDFIADDPWEDRNQFLKRMFANNYSQTKLKEKYIFRPFWIAEEDHKIVAIIINYFRAVERKWPESWSDFDKKGNVLPKSNGVKALMRFLRKAYKEVVPYYMSDLRIPGVEEFFNIFDKVEMVDSDFNIETFPPGTSGEAKLFNILDSTLKDQVDLF
ncbi:DGQHR domain-containing protein [Chromohalobacter beijerinckii]|uniref:DGQHR domain-containing protein n=1 Tax=Chromohalobacter beijerinckii TaxID=86179 RepID=A0ABV8X880_9GAMM|nr:DGQHR domain-containing protein [Chromohalobacter beijerinckii]MCK0766348.1 DGQHR domain-containing protein [Chromohalobacter beijerinckii]